MELVYRLLDWLIANDISASEVIMNMLLTFAGVAVLVSVWRLHKANSVYQNFNVVSLLVNKDGFLDGAKVMETGVFAVMTWGFVAMVASGKLTDAYTAAYVAAFAMRGAYGAFLRNKGEARQQPAGAPEDVTVVQPVKGATP